jgi:hypothetical protein
VFQTTLTSWSLAYDILLCWMWWHITADLHSHWRLLARTSVYLWIFLLCRLIKYTEHFCRFPADLVYMPLILVFGYFHSICIKLHAMFTLQVVSTSSAVDKEKGACRTRLADHVSRLTGVAGVAAIIMLFVASRQWTHTMVGF